ncbi:MAG: hypothetical protein N2491_09225 [Negativicutes bacterium]|nr:hypothetical protein [Negativicutes bacterium]
MKKIVLTVVCMFLLSSVGLAAPLMDYSKGKATLDYTYRPNMDIKAAIGVEGQIGIQPLAEYMGISEDGKFSEYTKQGSFDGKANMDWGLTYGLGNNWAIQYRQFNPTADLFDKTYGEKPNYLHIGLEGKIRSEEFNILYKFDKNVAGFAGIVRANAGVKLGLDGGLYDWTAGVALPELRTSDENMFQVGLIGNAKIAAKTNAYGVVALGSDYRSWQIGLSYALNKDIDFDVNYRNTKFDKFKVAGVYLNPPADSEFKSSYADLNIKDVEVKGVGFGLTFKF